MTEPTAPPTPSAEAPPPRPAAELRAKLDTVPRGSEEWKALMPELERAYQAEAGRGGVQAPTMPATATREELGAALTAAQAKLASLATDKGSPEYKQALADYQALLARTTPEARAPGAEPTAEQDVAEAEALTQVYAERLPPGETADVEALGELRAITRAAFGSAGDQAWAGGYHVATAALADIATRGLPDPVQTERTLRDLWRADFDAQFRAATEAWNMLPPRAQASLRERGVSDAVPFVIFMAEMGRKLYDAAGGLERLLSRLRTEAG